MNLNAKKQPGEFRKDAHLNNMGGLSYSLSPFVRLYCMAASSFFGEPMYYKQNTDAKMARRMGSENPSFRDTLSKAESKHVTDTLNLIDPKFAEWRSLSPAEAMEKAIDESLQYNAELTIRFLTWLRNEENFRTTPQVALARASRLPELKGTGFVKKYGAEIMARLDEPGVVLAYYLEKFGKPIPNALKKALKERLEKANEYQIAKYRKENHQVSLRDIVFLTHAHSPAIDKLIKDELRQTNKTWEAIVSKEGSTTESWDKAYETMGHMALLRNLRNLAHNGVDMDKVIEKLLGGVEGGKQFPFRYFSAYKQLEDNFQVRQALEKCIDLSIANLPKFSGRTLVLVDNSGSARGATTSSMGTMTVAEIGNLTGIVTCKASDEGVLGVFGDRLTTIPVGKDTKTLAMLQHAEEIGSGIGGGTEHGIWLAIDQITKRKEHFDRIFIYSDQQAGHGGLYGTRDRNNQYPVFPKGGYGGEYIDVPALINRYRNEVNKDCYVYSVQIGGYEDNIMPEFYNKTFMLSGWSPNLLRFAHYMEQTGNDIEEIFVEKFDLK